MHRRRLPSFGRRAWSDSSRCDLWLESSPSFSFSFFLPRIRHFEYVVFCCQRSDSSCSTGQYYYVQYYWITTTGIIQVLIYTKFEVVLVFHSTRLWKPKDFSRLCFPLAVGASLQLHNGVRTSGKCLGEMWDCKLVDSMSAKVRVLMSNEDWDVRLQVRQRNQQIKTRHTPGMTSIKRHWYFPWQTLVGKVQLT